MYIMKPPNGTKSQVKKRKRQLKSMKISITIRYKTKTLEGKTQFSIKKNVGRGNYHEKTPINSFR